jgi:hypothetical protein
LVQGHDTIHRRIWDSGDWILACDGPVLIQPVNPTTQDRGESQQYHRDWKTDQYCGTAGRSKCSQGEMLGLDYDIRVGSVLKLSTYQPPGIFAQLEHVSTNIDGFAWRSLAII